MQLGGKIIVLGPPKTSGLVNFELRPQKKYNKNKTKEDIGQPDYTGTEFSFK